MEDCDGLIWFGFIVSESLHKKNKLPIIVVACIIYIIIFINPINP